MVRGLGLDETALRLSQYLFSFRKRQANSPGGVFCHGRTATEFPNGHRPILSDQLQHNPPPHPTLQPVATEPECTPPGFRRSLPPPLDNATPFLSKSLAYPTVTDPADPPIRPERHVTNSITSARGVIARTRRRVPLLSARRAPFGFVTQ